MATIYHITARAAWRKSISRGQYAPDSLKSQGYVHCSTLGQLLDVANANFAGQDDLVILRIDTSDIVCVILYEGAADAVERYPHVYGPINHDAVKEVVDLPADVGGAFTLPEGLPA